MEFPIYQVPWLGNGMVIGLDATVHVLISHGFAIGLLSMIVLAEYLGYTRQSPQWEKFAYDTLKFAIVVIMAVGAVLGVGIWFVTSALEPRGIAALLRVFFWPWFVEWFAFTGEVIVILIYFYTWKRWTGERKAAHIRLGLAYMFFGVASAFLITGILGFMLTSDAWPTTRNFFAGFFNVTFWPQLLLRLSAAYTMGGVYAILYVLFTRREEAFRREALSTYGRLVLATAVAAAIFAAWYFAVVPSRFKAHAIFSVLTSYASQRNLLFWTANAIGALALLALAFASARGSRRTARALVIPVVLFNMAFVGEFERIREFIRGPYVMPGYMYANQVLLDETALFNQEGMLPHSYWYNATTLKNDVVSQGAYLFGHNCTACHTIGGINNIVTRVEGRSEDGIRAMIAHTNEMVPFMPPFSGTLYEQQVLARYLYGMANGQIPVGTPSRFMDVR